jgi:hypothetical protein
MVPYRNLALLLCAALLAACTQLPLRQREVFVPLSRLTEALSRRLGDERKILDVFSIKLGDPRLTADPAAQRLRADFGMALTHPFSSRPLTGRVAISGALGYDAGVNSVMLLEPRLEGVELDAVPPALRDAANRLAAALGRELAGSYPLVALRDKDLTAHGRQYRVAGFEIAEQGVRITLRATD